MILSLFTFLISCSKESETLPLIGGAPSFKSDSSQYFLTRDWEEDSYLVFATEEDVQDTYEYLQTEIESNVTSTAQMDAGIFNANLDAWESTQNGGDFISMRRAFEKYEHYGLQSGLAPEQIRDVPIINDALAALISPDGLVRVGDDIQYFSDVVYASAPISLKNRLREIVENGDPISPDDISNGIEITTRTKMNCNANFTFNINHNNKEVFVTYTGSSVGGGDKSIVWSIENGAGQHKNETSFSHQYSTVGEKTICVTYTETKVVRDTTYSYHLSLIDSTYIIPNSNPRRDTSVQVKKTTRVPIINLVKKVVCSSHICKSFTIGGCSPDFDITIGFDNVVSFVDKSTVNAGTITGWQWNFGDGSPPSTQQHPTHAYPCDRDFEVTLIIFSPQCLGGSTSVSRKIEVSGAACCDKNPQSPWKDEPHPSDNNKMIEYRYDMGTNWNWLFDQDFKAKIKYYEYRSGGIFGGTRWRKTDGLLDVNFSGVVFGKDEEDCHCIDPRTLNAQPNNRNDKEYTFKDDLSQSAFSTKRDHWMKDESPVNITYKVNGVTYLTQHCQSEPGFTCE